MNAVTAIIPCFILSIPFWSQDAQSFLQKEWIETNGLGAVISGTAGMANTRNYHAHYGLINKSGERITLVNNLEVNIIDSHGKTTSLSSQIYPGNIFHPSGIDHIKEFSSQPNPRWSFELGNADIITKEIIYIRNTDKVIVKFKLHGKDTYKLIVRPLMSGRSYFGIRKSYYPLSFPPLTVLHEKVRFHWDKAIPDFYMGHNGIWKSQELYYWNTFYPLTAQRAEDPLENLYSPGEVFFELNANNNEAFLVFSEKEESLADAKSEMQNEILRRNKRALKIKTNDPRLKLMAINSEHYRFTRIDGKKSILAGFPWFLDWGRDTFISMEGLVLMMGEIDEAHEILKNFATYEKNGLLPNMFPTLGSIPVYNSVDAPLWFIYTAFLSLQYGNDRTRFRTDLWPTIKNIINAYIRGTLYNIHMDFNDGLVVAGEDQVQLTWMDAKLDNWVVTPRRGKPIEISALWYHALKNAIDFSNTNGEVVDKNWIIAFELIQKNFEKKYYSFEKQHLIDVADAYDPQESSLLRPNVLYALSLASELISTNVALKTLSAVEENLLTPFGLRSLSPKERNYIGRYEGNLHDRDAAYHQGTTWAFLIGVYLDAKIKWMPEFSQNNLRKELDALLEEAMNFSIGHASEIFDGDSPWRPSGCFAQAWSDAEILRIAYKLNLWKYSSAK